MKAIKIIIPLALLFTGFLVSAPAASAQQIDANTPSHERPVVEESAFEELKAQDKPDDSEEMVWLKWALAIVLLSLIAAGGIIAYRVRRSPKNTKKS